MSVTVKDLMKKSSYGKHNDKGSLLDITPDFKRKEEGLFFYLR